MVAPTRYTNGISTFPPKHTLADFPVVTNSYQVAAQNEFMPYLSSQWTLTNTNATIAPLSINEGALSILSTTAAATKGLLSFTGNNATGQNVQFIPGNRLWFRTQIAVPSATQTNATTIFAGLFDTVDPSVATNGVWFTKPASQSAMNIVILKSGVTTTFTNVADLSHPDGRYGSSATAGTIALSASGTTANTPSITAGGSGYVIAPVVTVSGTAGSGAQMYAVVNSGSLYNAIVTNPGSGYTAGTFATTISHWVDLEMYYDGVSTLSFGVNGYTVLKIQIGGVQGITVGGTNNVATLGTSFAVPSTTQITSTTMTVLPPAGSPLHILPFMPLNAGVGLTSATAITSQMYVDSLAVAVDYN